MDPVSQGYIHVKPYDRIFIERNDVRRAVAELGRTLVSAERFGSALEA